MPVKKAERQIPSTDDLSAFVESDANDDQRESGDFLNARHKLLPFSEDVPVTVLPNSKIDWADAVASTDRPNVVRNSQVMSWQAMKTWNAEYFLQHLPKKIRLHVSKRRVVQMHSDVNPLGQVQGIRWERPFVEEEVETAELFGNSSSRHLYFLSRLNALPMEIKSQIGSLGFLSQPWRKIYEVNVWAGTPGVTTPAHYDVTNNFYVQVSGRKRFVLFPPADSNVLYLHPRIHPAGRQSQVDIDKWMNIEMNMDDNEERIFFPKFENSHPVEVVLSKGDILYIPPYWFHHVTALPPIDYENKDDVSISVSVCSDSALVGLRETMLDHTIDLDASDWKNGKYDDETLSLEKKVSSLRYYIYRFFQSRRDATQFVKKLVHSRYSTLLNISKNKDLHSKSKFGASRYVTGLDEKIQSANTSFLAILRDRGVPKLPKIVRSKLKKRAYELHARLETETKEFSDDQWDIELGNYFEDVIYDCLGPLNVAPFLHWLAGLTSLTPRKKYLMLSAPPVTKDGKEIQKFDPDAIGASVAKELKWIKKANRSTLLSILSKHGIASQHFIQSSEKDLRAQAQRLLLRSAGEHEGVIGVAGKRSDMAVQVVKERRQRRRKNKKEKERERRKRRRARGATEEDDKKYCEEQCQNEESNSCPAQCSIDLNDDDWIDGEAEYTRGDCQCRESWIVLDGTCRDGDATYKGCGMYPPCDGDNGGVPGDSWCVVEEDSECNPAGDDWDYCTPRTNSIIGSGNRRFNSSGDKGKAFWIWKWKG
eukprot:g1168.t1